MFRRLLMLVVLAFAFQTALPGIALARRPAGQSTAGRHAPGKKVVKKNPKQVRTPKHGKPVRSHGRRTHSR